MDGLILTFCVRLSGEPAAFMSQSQDKAVRRDLRRAIGSEAVEVMNRQVEAIGFMGQGMKLHAERLLALELAGYDTAQEISTLKAELDLRDLRAENSTPKNWRERLRWLVLGRCR